MPEVSRRRGKKPVLTRKTADKHRLYEMSVQDPEQEIEFIDKLFKKRVGRLPLKLREDFCGTSLLCKLWVESAPTRQAVGLDIDKPTLSWADKNNLCDLTKEQRKRVRLLPENVLTPPKEVFDIIVGLNFSYWCFKDRETLRKYLEGARKNLADDGILLLDAYGGLESQEVMSESRKVNGFSYVWDQAKFNPIDNSVVNYIHFEFKDGTKWKRAFTYDWRHWSLQEIREILLEAGFSDTKIYWDISDDDEDSDFRVRERVENQAGWLAFITAFA